MITLEAQKRESGGAKDLRRGGLLPAVVYGSKEASTPIVLKKLAFEAALKEAGESSVISLIGVGETKNVIIHDIARHPVSGAVLHVDLYAIEKGQTISVSVPILYTGVSNAVKELGCILVKVLHEVEIEAQPQDLPRGITVDVSMLATVGSKIHVRDLVLPHGVTINTDNTEPEEVVVMASLPQEEKEEVVVDMSKIEVEKKGKKEEPVEPAA